jgi:tetratricopeptide (TPR) repeat protein
MGVLLYEYKKETDKAIHHFKVAINEEANPTALFNLAVIYDERGDKYEAKKTYQDCLRIDPSHY